MDSIELGLVSKFNMKNPNSKILLFLISGSHFFDLNSQESDRDYRGVFMPSVSQLIEKTWPKQITINTNTGKNKNTKEDVDCIFYSLDEYLRLIAKGDFNLIETLFSPSEKVLITSQEFTEIQTRRDMFVPNDLSPFIGFAVNKCKKYWVDDSSVHNHVYHSAFGNKELYHGLRLLFEAKDIINFGAINLPFNEGRHEILKRAKTGQINKNEILSVIKTLLEEVRSFDSSISGDVKAKKKEDLLDWTCRYFYNKKQQAILGSTTR